MFFKPKNCSAAIRVVAPDAFENAETVMQPGIHHGDTGLRSVF
jgi:hypothetical protein